MLPEPMNGFFEKALSDNFDFYKVTFSFAADEGPYSVRDWNSKEIKLNRPDGTEAGEMGLSSMRYWHISRVSRKIPLGTRRNFTILELI